MRRLKPDPVPNELIRKILEAGVCAPSGGNMQRWRFLVIRDPKIKETIGALYKRAWDEQVAPRYRAGEPAPGTSRERSERMLAAAEHLAAHIHEAPVWIIPCLEGRHPPPPRARSEHAVGGKSRRPRRDIDDASLTVREGSGGRDGFAAELPLLCLAADRLPHGPVWSRPPCPSRRCRL